MPHITVTPTNRLPQPGDDIILARASSSDSDYWYVVDHPQAPFEADQPQGLHQPVVFRRSDIITLNYSPIGTDRDGQPLDSWLFQVVISAPAGTCTVAIGFTSESAAREWIYDHAAEWLS